MLENQDFSVDGVVGPEGKLLTLSDLPPVSARWTPLRKAEVVAAVTGGLLSFDQACERYSISVEEFAGWVRSLDRAGLKALRVTHPPHRREISSP